MGLLRVLGGVVCWIIGILLLLDVAGKWIMAPMIQYTTISTIISILELVFGLALFYYGKNLMQGK